LGGEINQKKIKSVNFNQRVEWNSGDSTTEGRKGGGKALEILEPNKSQIMVNPQITGGAKRTILETRNRKE